MMARIGIGNQEADRFVAQAFCPPNGSQAFSRTRPTRFQRVAFCRLQACRPSQPRWLTSVWKPKFATARRRRPVAAATAPRGDPLSRVHGLAPGVLPEVSAAAVSNRRSLALRLMNKPPSGRKSGKNSSD